jgi:hypothetical protein
MKKPQQGRHRGGKVLKPLLDFLRTSMGTRHPYQACRVDYGGDGGGDGTVRATIFIYLFVFMMRIQAYILPRQPCSDK